MFCRTRLEVDSLVETLDALTGDRHASTHARHERLQPLGRLFQDGGSSAALRPCRLAVSRA